MSPEEGLSTDGTWPEDVVEILGGDLVVALASRTPAGGVVITPIAPIGDHDPDQRTVTITTSLAFPQKLRRVARDDRVAFALSRPRAWLGPSIQFGPFSRPGGLS